MNTKKPEIIIEEVGTVPEKPIDITLAQLFNMTRGTLCAIEVPVGLKTKVTDPICKALDYINVIEASVAEFLKQAYEQKKEDAPASKENKPEEASKEETAQAK